MCNDVEILGRVGTKGKELAMRMREESEHGERVVLQEGAMKRIESGRILGVWEGPKMDQLARSRSGMG
jgi:hypothetical protein